jgi:hypothetical protein
MFGGALDHRCHNDEHQNRSHFQSDTAQRAHVDLMGFAIAVNGKSALDVAARLGFLI